MLPLSLIIVSSFAVLVLSFSMPRHHKDALILRLGSGAVFLSAALFAFGKLPFWPVAALITLGFSFFAYIFYIQAVELKSRSDKSAAAFGGFALMAVAAIFV